MPNPRLASRYAKSLLDLAVEQNNVEDTLGDMQYLKSLCKQSRDFTNVLRSPVINADKKQSILGAVLGNNLKQLSAAFIKLLVNKGREEHLPEIADSFIAQYKEKKNIKSVKLTSAAPMNDNLKQAILAKVQQSMPDAQIEMEEKVNEDLIGGFVLQVDDKLFDASVRRDLNDVKAQFSKNIYIANI